MKQINVVTADDVEGFVVRHKLRDGKAYIENHEVVTERVTGFVEFRPRV